MECLLCAQKALGLTSNLKKKRTSRTRGAEDISVLVKACGEASLVLNLRRPQKLAAVVWEVVRRKHKCEEMVQLGGQWHGRVSRVGQLCCDICCFQITLVLLIISFSLCQMTIGSHCIAWAAQSLLSRPGQACTCSDSLVCAFQVQDKRHEPFQLSYYCLFSNCVL